jgi:hypothetical protein
MEWLAGKKTYIVAFVTALLGLIMAIWPEFQLPEWVNYLLAAAGVTTVRIAIANGSK